MKHHYNKEELVELKRKYDMQVEKNALDEIKASIDLVVENERLHSIIKEAREYITNQRLHKFEDTTGGLTYEERKLLEILERKYESVIKESK